MSGLYDEAVKAIFRSHPAPKGLVADIVEYEYWITLRLYRDNFESFSRLRKQSIILWVEEVMQALNTVVKCYLEVFPNAPKGLHS